MLPAKLTMILIEIYRLKFAQMTVELEPHQLAHVNFYLVRLRRDFIAQIVTLQHCNRLSSFLVAFLVVHAPFNCVVVCSLALEHMSPFGMFIMLAWALYEFFCILGIHLMLAKLNERIHRPVKLFMRYVRYCKHSKAGQMLRKAHFIEAFHTRRKYGVTYMTFGRVSMSAYVKVRTHQKWIQFVYFLHYSIFYSTLNFLCTCGPS